MLQTESLGIDAVRVFGHGSILELKNHIHFHKIIKFLYEFLVKYVLEWTSVKSKSIHIVTLVIKFCIMG
jgi:hypothetical protein